MNFNVLLIVVIVFLLVFLVAAIAFWIAEGVIEKKVKANGWQALSGNRYVSPDGEIIEYDAWGRIVSDMYVVPANSGAEPFVDYAAQQPAEEPAPAPVEEAVAEEAVVAEAVAEPEPEVVEESTPIDEMVAEAETEDGNIIDLTQNSVLFERNEEEFKSFNEKYKALDPDHQKLLDKVFEHILAVEGVRRIDSTNQSRVKYRTQELFTVKIKRGVPVFSFKLANTSLTRYVKEEGIKNIKITPVTIKLTGEEDLGLTIRTTDMALEQAKDEIAYKHEKRKEARRAREAAKNNTNN